MPSVKVHSPTEGLNISCSNFGGEDFLILASPVKYIVYKWEILMPDIPGSTKCQIFLLNIITCLQVLGISLFKSRQKKQTISIHKMSDVLQRAVWVNAAHKALTFIGLENDSYSKEIMSLLKIFYQKKLLSTISLTTKKETVVSTTLQLFDRKK